MVMSKKSSPLIFNALCNLSQEVFVVTSPAPDKLFLTQCVGAIVSSPSFPPIFSSHSHTSAPPLPTAMHLSRIFAPAFGKPRNFSVGTHMLGWSTERAKFHMFFLLLQHFATMGYEMPV